MNDKVQYEVEYQELINKVALVDKNAADYMQKEMRDLCGLYELAYLRLIEKVKLIDEAAAMYMQGPMRKIEGFELTGDLWDVVVWDYTEQGCDYWHDIACKLGQ